ncbi:hypothetical protein [Nocardiopsis sp. FR26]|uniref:hypothetical protein n=1 Tax=Nocardiopsis sp. FR26 TaxID=2605987 RepID=UPI00135CD38A|nr:hypothetical protein [Nocardiopsis sp. FR26]
MTTVLEHPGRWYVLSEDEDTPVTTVCLYEVPGGDQCGRPLAPDADRTDFLCLACQTAYAAGWITEGELRAIERHYQI